MKIIKTGGWVLSIIFFLILTNAQTIVKKPYGHPDYVPNKETAIKVAVAIWLPIYGSEIYQDTPYNATLKNSSVWIITGSFSGDE
ncbi:MAG TPA: NTF2 fold immunity protein, partial [Chitinophagaceae bacterium]|nr:NTF2 fold immunity protein [Chitinophagaceae bacterium]